VFFIFKNFFIYFNRWGGGGEISKIMLISLKYDTFYSDTQFNYIIEYII